jgi:hypothetical protein
MAGISLLPPWLGRFYVVNLRRYPAYDVETFPVASRIGAMLRKRGITILDSSFAPGVRWENYPPVTRALKKLAKRICFNTRSMFWFLGTKSG